MVRGAGIALKTIQWFLRAIEFCCAAVVLAIFSYFLATLHNHNLTIDNYIRSVEGLSGGAALYTLIALVLLCFLGGFTIFAIIAFLLDLLFVGAFVYIAYQNRQGASSCNGFVNTPFGSGDDNTNQNEVTAPQGGVTLLPSLREACRLETACFAVSIVAIVFFLISALLEIAMWRHHRAEKKYGPSPANDYTTGYPHRRFWHRKGRRDAELAAGAGGLAAEKHHHDQRTSYATDNTAVGSTGEPVNYKYGHNAGAMNDGYATTGAGGLNDGYAGAGAVNDGYTPAASAGTGQHHLGGNTAGEPGVARPYGTAGTNY